jgi:hypothetical protein
VRTADGLPATGAVVIAASGAGASVDIAIDEQGAFALADLVPGPIELQAGFGHAGDGPLVQASLWLEPGGALLWEPIVELPRDFSGRLLDPRGAPLAGGWLRAVPTETGGEESGLSAEPEALAAWLAGRPDRHLLRSLSMVQADAQGNFTLPSVPAALAVEVRLPEGRAGWPVQVFAPPPAGGELVLASLTGNTAGLTGTLAGPDGAELAMGEVFAVHRSGGDVRQRLVQGSFRFENLPPGTFDLLVWARGLLPRVVATVTLAAGEQRDLGWLQLAP